MNPPTGTNHMVYNAADQLTSWPGMHTYTYYGDGSLYQVKDSAGTNVLKSYTYTNDGLLASATYNSRTLTNTWDAAKNRVSFTAGGTTHTFVYDTTAGVPAVIDEDGVYYVREPDGSLIARLSGSDVSYYHFDALGSTRLLTSSAGAVTDKYSYDAYGSLITHDEYTGHVDQPYQYVGRLGYYTHYQEPDFGLLQLGVRFYDAQMGRFTQVDPIRYGVVLYSYVGGGVLFSTDPSGLMSECDKAWLKDCIDKAVEDHKKAEKDLDKQKKWDKIKMNALCGVTCSPLLTKGKKAYGACVAACTKAGMFALEKLWKQLQDLNDLQLKLDLERCLDGPEHWPDPIEFPGGQQCWQAHREEHCWQRRR